MKTKIIFILSILLFCVAATLYRDATSSGDLSRGAPADLGLMPTNSPNVGDVLSVGPGPVSVWASLTNFIRVWSGTTGNALLGIGTTTFLPPNNTSATLSLVDAVAGTRTPLTRATTLQNLYAIVTPTPGVGKTTIFTVLTNGVASPLTVSIAGALTNGNDTTHFVSVPSGTEIGVKIVTAASSTAGKAAWSFEGR